MRTATRLPPTSSTIGTGDALDDLQRDHREVEALFARSALVMGPERQAVAQRIAHALTVHAELEERVIYPAIAAAIGSGEMVIDRAEAEHDQMKALLGRVAKAKGDDPAEIDDLRALQLVVQQHVAVEEGYVFPAYRQVATAEQLAELDGEAARARAAAPPPPEGDGEGLGDLLGGAVAEVVGKVREVVTGDGGHDEKDDRSSPRAGKTTTKRAAATKPATAKAAGGSTSKKKAAAKRSPSTKRGAR